jgi:hypothetical protein
LPVRSWSGSQYDIINVMNKREKIIRSSGILEGEGTFITKTNGHRPIVACQMTDQDVIFDLQKLWGGRVYYSKARQKGYKDVWRWQVGGDEAVELMKQIRPFMYSRRKEKIDQVIKVWENQKKKLNKIKENGDKAAKEYLSTDLSLRQVAKKYGIGYETVRRHIKNIN